MATILAIGGAGEVGQLIIPQLRGHHHVRILDLRAPNESDGDNVQADLTDPIGLADAMRGVDVLLFMAMGPKRFEDLDAALVAFDISVKGLYLALRLAHEAGIGHAIYISSVSVFKDWSQRRLGPEDASPADATHFYGLSKRLGEEVCRSATSEWGITVNALRLCLPVSTDELGKLVETGEHECHLGADDLVRAILAAVDYRDGFQAFTVTGDYGQRMAELDKARRLLGWQPTDHSAGRRRR